MYDIKIRFPNKEMADSFCGQMSDGMGEGFCDFSHWKQIPGTDGSEAEHFVKVEEEGVMVYFVNAMFEDHI